MTPSPQVEAEPVAWRCAKCDCRTFARMDTRLADTSFGPGDFVRCVNCKDVSFFPDLTVMLDEREAAIALNNKYAWERDKAREERDAAERKSEAFWKPRLEAAEAQLAAMRELAAGIKWQSSDKDNMEFFARITCWQMDALRTLTPEPMAGDNPETETP